MTNEEAKIFLQSRIKLIDKYYPQVEDYREALGMAIEALEQTRWIPVSERMPEKDEVVLITNKWHEVDKALYIGDEMFDIIINYLQKEEVVAWMPLPQPYKESEDEE